MKGSKQSLPAGRREALLSILKTRFEKNRHRHQGLEWAAVESRLVASPDKLRSLDDMENTGGEPDVIAVDRKSGECVFVDCAAESPAGRRSVCYDREGLESRKEHRPENNAVDMAAAMGIEILTEAEYRELQKLGEFDLKTSSWVRTPADIRKLGGALFCDRRFGHVFVYHNGAQSVLQRAGIPGFAAGVIRGAGGGNFRILSLP